jgi:hypothetical protein
VKGIAETVKEARKLAWDSTERRKEIQNKYHDGRAKPVDFQGQLVYRKEMTKKAKVKEKWRGPYKVL